MRIFQSAFWYAYFSLFHLIYRVGCWLIRPPANKLPSIVALMDRLGRAAAWQRSDAFLRWRASR